jgi:hypothetical protein
LVSSSWNSALLSAVDEFNVKRIGDTTVFYDLKSVRTFARNSMKV